MEINKLIREMKGSEWKDFGSDGYAIIGEKKGIMFKCPGCDAIIGIATAGPGWTIDFENLTAKPSILHTPPHGCGWHGYLTNGELRPC